MKPVVLCILDGVGISDEIKGNAFKQAKTPNLDMLFTKYPNSELIASGEPVGLPNGIMGNSEVGHLNIGAGRVVFQNIELINNSIKNKDFFQNTNLLELINFVKKNNSKLHLMGLISDAGVHSRLDHLFALIDLCKQVGISEVYIHGFTDGRDTPVDSSSGFIEKIEAKLKESGIGRFATIGGRYYGMDRDNRYERVEKAYDVITGNSDVYYESASSAVGINHSKDITDEFIVPGIILKEGIVENNDGIVFFNFRPDRLRELGSSLTAKDFHHFNRKKTVDIKLVTMMPVSDEVVCKNAFSLQNLNNTFGKYISDKGLKQLRIAETEKYAHVTYFFDGGVELDLKNCKRILIPSPKIETYDLKPEMSAYEITDNVLKELSNFDIIILNYANGDMVGHTGNLNATIKGIEVLDKCVIKIYEKIKKLDGTLIITSDHGNSEYMLDEKNNIVTSHTTNKTPFLITKNVTLKDGKLADIAPTILNILGIDIPDEMTGDVLIEDR